MKHTSAHPRRPRLTRQTCPTDLTPRGLALVLCVALISLAPAALGEEVYLQDGRRFMAMVETVDAAGTVRLRLPDGRMEEHRLREVESITFRGREVRSIPAGAQEFHMVSGDRLRAEIVGLRETDNLGVVSPAVGEVELPLAAVRGFITMPVEGRAGRRAVELVTGDEDEPTGMMDRVLDRRTSLYEGVIEGIDSSELLLDHERMRRTVPLKIIYLAGVRLARVTRRPRPPLPAAPFIRIATRDHSALMGLIESVADGMWRIRPLWQPAAVVAVRVDEMTRVEVLNGVGVYLSQLEVAEAVERTILAPAQPYRMNGNSLGLGLSIAGNAYEWGIGVHATSELTFEIGGVWSTFAAAVGIDDAAGGRGSVVMSVLGDGRELWRSGVLRGSDPAPVPVRVPVKGVRRLTLKVEATDDLDLGDLADWAAARLIR